MTPSARHSSNSNVLDFRERCEIIALYRWPQNEYLRNRRLKRYGVAHCVAFQNGRSFGKFAKRADGTGLEAMSDKTARCTRDRQCGSRAVGLSVLRRRLRSADLHKDGKLISIEGDPESPISQGNLCPKGAASYQLLTHDRRETKMKISRAAREAVDRNSAQPRDGHGGGPRLGIAQAHVRAQEREGRDDQSHDRDLPSRRLRRWITKKII